MTNLEILPPEATQDLPPLMPWRAFAGWLREDPAVVRGWLDKGYLPTVRIGRRRLINLVALVDQLRENEI